MNIELATATTMPVSTRNVKLMVAAPLLVAAAEHMLRLVSSNGVLELGKVYA